MASSVTPAPASSPPAPAPSGGLNLNPLDAFGISSVVSSGVSAAVSDVEHFAAKALLVIVGLALVGYGVVSLVSGNKKPSEAIEPALGAAALA